MLKEGKAVMIIS